MGDLMETYSQPAGNKERRDRQMEMRVGSRFAEQKHTHTITHKKNKNLEGTREDGAGERQTRPDDPHAQTMLPDETRKKRTR
jgi:hypothetical protein